MSFDKTVLGNLLLNEEYCRKVLPFLKEDYFDSSGDKKIFTKIEHYFTKYNRLPSKKELALEFESEKIAEAVYKEIAESLGSLDKNQIENLEWMVERTEKFCKDKALYQALLKSIEVAEGNSKEISTGSIPKMLQDALAVCFDPKIGHDYLGEAESRWDFYHHLEKKVPFDIEFLNKITNGGLPEKSLTVWVLPTGGGKSMIMCHCASANLSMGYNVLYITMEMSEEKISERIDANLLNIDIAKMGEINKSTFLEKIDKLSKKTRGQLIVKEYPENGASVGNFKFLLNELRIKKNFIPDIIYVDYAGIVASSRLKKSNHNSYEYGKAVYEELRALAKEFSLPVVTGAQTNRSGWGSSDLEMGMFAETAGGPMTADLVIGATQPAEMVELNQMLFIQMKNRNNDPNNPRRFVVGVDWAKMRLYDCDASAQSGILEGPVMDNTPSFADKFEGFS